MWHWKPHYIVNVFLPVPLPNCSDCIQSSSLISLLLTASSPPPVPCRALYVHGMYICAHPFILQIFWVPTVCQALYWVPTTQEVLILLWSDLHYPTLSIIPLVFTVTLGRLVSVLFSWKPSFFLPLYSPFLLLYYLDFSSFSTSDLSSSRLLNESFHE